MDKVFITTTDYLYIRFDNGNAYNALYARWSSNNQWVSAQVPNQTLTQAQLYNDGVGYYVRSMKD